MSTDPQIQTFIEDQEDTIPEYLKPLFVQQANFINTTQGEGVSEDVHGIDPGYDYSQTSLGRGLFGVAMAAGLPMGSLAIDKIDPTVKVNPLKAAIASIEAFGKPRDPNETLGERYSSLIEESKRSDPNRETAYGHIGGPNSYSMPGTSFSKGITDEDVLGMTKDQALSFNTAFDTLSPEAKTHAVQALASEDSPAVGSRAFGSGMFGDQSYDTPDTGNENEGDQGAAAGTSAGSSGTGSGRGGTGSSGSLGGGYDSSDSGSSSGSDSSGSGGAGDAPGAADSSQPFQTGGRIGALIQHLQTGGEAENADTNMEVANVPMGVVSDADGAPGPFSGGTGVEDDLDMEVEAGSYVLNAEAVQLIGISDINEVIRDAYAIAVALGKEVPADYDPQNKVPIRISNGEAVIPKALVDIIGLDKLEKWNQKGLQLRKQKEKFMAQQQQQPPQGPQVAAEAPMQQQMGQLMAKGGEAEEEEDFFKLDIDFIKKLDSWMDKYNKTRTDKKNYLNTNNARVLAKTIAMQESDSLDPDVRQNPKGFSGTFKNLMKSGSIFGPGRGLYQYEQEGLDQSTQEAAKTAVTQAKKFNPNISWLSKFKDKKVYDVRHGKKRSLEDYDVRKLTGKEQTELFIIDHLMAKQDIKKSPGFIDTVNNDNLTGEQAFEYWINHHKRKGSVSTKRKDEFIKNYNNNKNEVYEDLEI